MKQYRLGYNFIFLPQKSFHYKNEYIGAMCINVLFKVFNDDGSEKFFESGDGNLREQAIFQNENEFYLAELLICSFDRDEILTFNPNVSLLRKAGFSFSWEIQSYDKAIDEGILEPEEITEAEFMDIMKNNIDTFDNSNNHSAQTTSYFTQEIEVSEISN